MALITEITLPKNLVKVNEIRISTLFDLEDNTARVVCKFLRSDNKKMVSQTNLVIPEEIYTQWGVDNQFIIDWVSEKLGITLI
jgi:hypothetical protein